MIMTPILVYALILHVVLGVIAIGLTHLVFMHYIRQKPDWKYLLRISGSAALLYMVSWIAAAYYYVTYYGTAVKPVIVGGAYPWAHTVMMEAKEHVFLMIPFAAITIWLCTDMLSVHPTSSIKSKGAIFTLLTVVLGVFVAVAGIFVSGGVR
jgi:hypothetical protein